MVKTSHEPMNRTDGRASADPLGTLTREQFAGLAQRCRLKIELPVLDMLRRRGILPALGGGNGKGQPRYAPVQLWVLSRYMELVRFTAHPWEPWPSSRPGSNNQALEVLREQARVLTELIQWSTSNTQSPPPASARPMAELLREWLAEHPSLGPLRQVLPLLRSELRAGLRGEALLSELVHSFCERLEAATEQPVVAKPKAAPRSAPRPIPTLSQPPPKKIRQPEDVPALPDPAPAAVMKPPGPSSRSGSKPAPRSVDRVAPMPNPVKAAPAPAADPPAAAKPALPASAKPAPGAEADAGSWPVRETIPLDLPSQVAREAQAVEEGLDDMPESLVQAMSGANERDKQPLDAPPKFSPTAGVGGGLRAALARAREAAERRTAHGQTRKLEAPKPRSTQEMTIIKAPDEHLPTTIGSVDEPEVASQDTPESSPVAAEPAKQAVQDQEAAAATEQQTSSGAQASLEAQVLKLNELRGKYTRSESWDKLVKLFEEGIYLFPDAAERRGAYLYIGALYEQKLKNPDKALEAYTKAFECVPGDRDAYLAIERAYASTERWDDLLDLMDQCMASGIDGDFLFEVQLGRASLLATVLDEPRQALAQYHEIFDGDLNADQKREALSGLAQLARLSDVDSDLVLAAATVLEGYWGIDAHSDELIQLYEDMFDNLNTHDKEAAAEVMSRLAASYQATDRLRNAFVALVRALSCNPEREDIFIRLESLAERLDGLRELAAIYEDDLESVLGQKHRAMLGRRLANLYQRLDDDEGIRRGWQLVSDADPFDVEALMRLSELYQKAQEYTILLETLDRLRSLVEGAPRTQLLLRLADIRTRGMTEPEGPAADVMDVDAAFTALQDALASVEHGSSMAQRVVSSILEMMKRSVQTFAFQLSELLEQFFAQHGDYKSIINVLETLVTTHLSEPEGRIEAGRLMNRIGQLHEEQLDQSDMAFLYYAKSLRLDPEGDEPLGRVQALATSKDQLYELAALYEEVLDSGRVQLRDLWLKRLATLYDERLEESDRALRFYHELYELQREDEEALDFLERYHTDKGQWEEVINIILSRADSEGSVATRKELLERAASISLEELGNEPLAIATLRRILTIDPNDGELMERIVVLYRTQGNLDELGEFLARQAELAREPAVRAEVMMRHAELLSRDLGQNDKALEVLTRLRAMRPREPQVLRLMESLYTAEGRELEAYAVLKSLFELLDKEPNNLGETHNGEQERLLARLAGMAETVLGSSDEAAVHYKALLARSPHNLQAIGQLERIFEENKNWADLLKILQTHIKLMLEQGEKAAALVLVERQLEVVTEELVDGDMELSCLSRILRLGGELTLGQFERMAELARQQQQWKLCLEANEGFVAQLEDPADRAAVLQEMSQLAEQKLSDVPLATTFLERDRDACPEDVALLQELVTIYRAAGRHPQLAETLRLLIDLEESLTPDQVVRYCRDLSETLDKHSNEPRQAVGMLERALGIIRESPDKVSRAIQDSIRRRAVHLYTRLGEHEAALGHLQELASTFDERGMKPELIARTREEMARLALKLERFDEAEQHYLSAVEADEESVTARLGLAEVHLARSRWTEATVLLEGLSEQLEEFSSPKDKGRIFAGLGRAYSATNKVGKAVEAYREALVHDPANTIARDALE